MELLNFNVPSQNLPEGYWDGMIWYISSSQKLLLNNIYCLKNEVNYWFSLRIVLAAVFVSISTFKLH